MWWTLLALAGGATVGFAGAKRAVVPAAKPDFSEAKRRLQQAIEDRAFPGCAVLVGTDRAVLWSGAFGYFDYEKKERVTPKTIYDLASLTKVAGTTTVFMRLVARGEVSPADPIAQHLPEFIAGAESPEERARRARITVEHLLTHSAGLAAWKPFYRTNHSYARLLAAIYQTPLEFEPGERFRYSDLGMILAGEVAARVGGRPLKELEQMLVFRPLGMKDTLRNPPAALHRRIPPTEVDPETGRALCGVVHDENARAAGGITGHAGLFATAADLGKLSRELLRASEGRSALFPQPVVAEFFRARQIGRNTFRALGWGIVDLDTSPPSGLLAHIGFTGTSVHLDLDRKWFVVLLTNRVHPTRANDKISAVRRELVQAVAQTLACTSNQ